MGMVAPASTHPKGTGSRDRGRVARHLRRDIEGTLAARDRESTRLAGVLRSAGAVAWTGLKRHPLAGTLIAAGVGLSLAELVGVGEVGLAFGFGYVA